MNNNKQELIDQELYQLYLLESVCVDFEDAIDFPEFTEWKNNREEENSNVSSKTIFRTITNHL